MKTAKIFLFLLAPVSIAAVVQAPQHRLPIIGFYFDTRKNENRKKRNHFAPLYIDVTSTRQQSHRNQKSALKSSEPSFITLQGLL